MSAQNTATKSTEKFNLQDSQLHSITSFLEEIGIEYFFTGDAFDSFLVGIEIEHGRLKINLDNLLCHGDILHEAGHLACLTPDLRRKAHGDIGKTLGEENTFELGVIAWSVAAALYLGIPLSEIFHPESYKGDATWLLEQYTAKTYIGLPLLQWMGMAAHDDELVENKVLPYPHMIRWTRQ
ncbi:hypothetical protein [Roseivirga sp. E12]|uniref:hypothetical protein n=1 Tax=Roseivirga sp. E12 TaxID=2819237 RepID=UPI001ABC3200|nr:hypothetical protein [Roseivirga sp. E12]MBO3696837.1 hypothetical protein [Roseivirga sp. E12]